MSKKFLIYIVTGEKGGVGKTRTSLVLSETLAINGTRYVAVEADASNPDFGRRDLAGDPAKHFLNLRATSDAWAELVELIENAKASGTDAMIINMPAQAQEFFERFGGIFVDVITEDDDAYELRGLYVISNTAEALNQARATFASDFGNRFHSWRLVRNHYFGGPEDFDKLDDSDLKDFPRIDLPKLHNKEVDKTLNNNYGGPLAAAAEKGSKVLRTYDRAELWRWLHSSVGNFAEAL